jgi:putrescine transport system substrate-binding protein
MTNTGSLAAMAVMVAASAAAAEELRIYNWADYVDPSVLSDFTAETGIEIVYDVFDSNETLQTRLLTGQSGYDIVAPTASYLPRLIAAGVLTELDKGRLPNLANAWPEIFDRVAFYDPGNAHAVPYMWGSVGIAYVEEEVAARMPDAPTDSWRLIFDPEVVARFADCGVTMYDSPDDMIAIALRFLGRNPNSTEPVDIEAASDLLAGIRPHLLKFQTYEQVSAIANAEICVTVGTGGVFLQAQDTARESGRNHTITFSNPKEGSNLWIDTFAIPVDAPNPDAAYAFIDFIYRPEIAARLSNFTRYANGNFPSQVLIDPALLSNPAVYPPADAVKASFTLLPYPQDAQRLVTRAWTAFKTGQ